MSDLLTVPDLEAKLGIGEKKVRALFKDPDNPLKAFKVGREWRVHPDDYAEWLSRQRKQAVA